jgi:hypothetical protein
VTPQSRRRTADNPVLWFRRAAVRYAGLVDQLRTYPRARDVNGQLAVPVCGQLKIPTSRVVSSVC